MNQSNAGTDALLPKNPTALAAPATPLLRYLRHPQFGAGPPSRLTVWRWVGWLCLLLLVASLAGLVVQGGLARAFGWHASPDAYLKYLSTHPSLMAAAILLLGPILEELAFRAFMSTSPRAIFIGIGFFLVYLYGFVNMRFVHVSSRYAIDHFARGMLMLVPAAIISLLLYWLARKPILALFREHAAWVFWIACVVFGAGHAVGYTHAWWGFVLALPQFLVGIGLACIRVNFGLRWSIATHCAFDWGLMAFAWGWLAFASDPAAKAALSLAASLLILFVLVYGSVALVRVARQRW